MTDYDNVTLLAPPSSPQLIGSLRSMFPKARVIIVEIEDDVLGVSYHGPVRRMLDAGVETYLTSTTIPSLAKQLESARLLSLGAVRLADVADGWTTFADVEGNEFDLIDGADPQETGWPART